MGTACVPRCCLIWTKMDAEYQKSLFKRLSTPKLYEETFPESQKKWRRSPKEAQAIFDRLHTQTIKCRIDPRAWMKFCDPDVKPKPVDAKQLDVITESLHERSIKCKMFQYNLPIMCVDQTFQRANEKNEKFYQEVRSRQQLLTYSKRNKTLISLKPPNKSPRKIHYVF